MVTVGKIEVDWIQQEGKLCKYPFLNVLHLL